MRCHSTTRSPIVVSLEREYPLHSRYELKSLYDPDRRTFLYDIEKYDKVFVITSGENMAIHAAANIAMAVENFRNRGYASLGGIILNKREVPREEEKVRELAGDFHTQIIGQLDRSELGMEAEEAGKVLLEYAPDSQMAEEYRKLADQILAVCGEERPC